MKILTIVGARPQFIKAAVVSRCIRASYEGIQEEILHTGQHYDYEMSQVFFDEMDIPAPSINLNVGSGSHARSTATMLTGIEEQLLERKPDYLLVYGDTNSTLAGAMAAAKLHIPIIHIEAGERSYNKAMPEEINRLLTDHLSSILFCCSNKSKVQLQQEGIVNNVFVVGDVMYDAFLKYTQKSLWPSTLAYPQPLFALATLHRAHNIDTISQLTSLLEALSALADNIILPLHPRTQKTIHAHNIQVGANIQLIDPVSYFEMLALLKECAYVITDSGGLQKEAYYAKKKCITLRNETEWTELVENGVNRVVGNKKASILEAAEWAKTASTIPDYIYGDGRAGEKILQHLIA